jgi:hypothetical protein
MVARPERQPTICGERELMCAQERVGTNGLTSVCCAECVMQWPKKQETSKVRTSRTSAHRTDLSRPVEYTHMCTVAGDCRGGPTQRSSAVSVSARTCAWWLVIEEEATVGPTQRSPAENSPTPRLLKGWQRRAVQARRSLPGPPVAVEVRAHSVHATQNQQQNKRQHWRREQHECT